MFDMDAYEEDEGGVCMLVLLASDLTLNTVLPTLNPLSYPSPPSHTGHSQPTASVHKDEEASVGEEKGGGGGEEGFENGDEPSNPKPKPKASSLF